MPSNKVRLRSLAVGLLIAGCGHPPSSTTDAGGVTDAGSPGDSGTPFSACGHPGDQGNSLGIGKYCTKTTDCQLGQVCSFINNNPANPSLNSFFCSQECDPCAPVCGENASCVCQGPGACGCTPNACSAIFPDAGALSCPDGGTTDAGAADAGGGTDAGAPSDAGGTDAGNGDGGCVPSPPGTCTPTPCSTGNEKNVGAYCTMGGNQCAQYGNILLACAIDLDSSGGNFCIQLLCNLNSDCGSQACCIGNLPDGGGSQKACIPIGCTDNGVCPGP